MVERMAVLLVGKKVEWRAARMVGPWVAPMVVQMVATMAG